MSRALAHRAVSALARAVSAREKYAASIALGRAPRHAAHRARFVARASDEDSASTSSDATAPAGVERKGRFVRASAGAAAPPAPLGSGPGDVGTSGSAPATMNIKVIPLETTRFQGVAKATERESADEIAFRRAQLVAGDALALVVFAAIGRMSHGEGAGAAETLATAAPFALGWFGAAKILDAFGDDARGSDGKKAAIVAAKTWAVGVPTGLALRALVKGAAPPTPFVVVSMAVTAAFLVGWRTWFATTKGPIGKNKRGNPLEFLSLLSSLVKRW